MNYQKEIKNITTWLSDYQKNSKTKGYVVGLSGGIDSAIIACLAVKAVGKDNVIGVSLPCQTRDDMKDDAKDLAENLGIRFLTIPLEESFNAIDIAVSEAMYPHPEEKFTSPLSKGNTKARLRMTALYEVANEMNYLVAGTSNKSELMISYFTKFGDGGVDIEPIGSYYKTEIYKMAELMPEIPKSIINKKPSADLWENQSDEQELGMPYSEIDQILKTIEAGTTNYLSNLPQNVEKIKKMIKKAEHKNNMPPRYIRK